MSIILQGTVASLAAGSLTVVGAVPILFGRQVSVRTQDTLLAVWRRAGAYDPRRAAVGTWMIAIARNRAVDLLRSRTHQARLREQAPLTAKLRASESGTSGTDDAVGLRRVILTALQGLCRAAPSDRARVLRRAHPG